MTSGSNQDLDKVKKITLVLSNEFSRKIIFSIISKAKSGIEISNDTKLSQSTVYQKLIILKDLSLVQVDYKEVTWKGRIIEFYKSTITKATIIITKEQPKIILVHN